ncbi:MAG: pantetheine-phosphate adenylyltransferase [Candidatus Bathyarchaeota archaeon]
MDRKFHKVAVGGTFDLLHRGHICLLRTALKLGDIVAIGLTTDEILQAHPKNHFVANFSNRRRELDKFLKKSGVINRIQIIPLTHPYGTVVTDNEIEALIVSYETVKRSEEINEIRLKKGFKPVKLIVMDAILADDGLPISSTRIRRGDIDRNGHVLSGK